MFEFHSLFLDTEAWEEVEYLTGKWSSSALVQVVFCKK